MRASGSSSLLGLAVTTFASRSSRYVRFSHSGAAVAAAVAPEDNLNSNWVASNSLYRRHPRLLSLELCRRSPWQLRTFLAYTIVAGLFWNPFVASRVLHCSCCAEMADMSFASLIFRQMEQPSTFSWNTIIRGFAESEEHSPSLAFSLYRQMLERRVPTDKYTYPFLLKACRSESCINVGRMVHAHCLVSGFSTDPFVQTVLVNMYLRCGYNGLAFFLFDRMSQKDVVSWTGVISGLNAGGYFEQALDLFRKMRSNGFSARPNVVTMVSAVSACAGLGSLDHTSMDNAAKIFHLMEERDLHSWTTTIMGLATHGMAREALNLFADMRCIGIVPDSITFVAVLSACSHTGLVDEGLKNFKLMEREYKIVPGLKHYGCMVDLLSRAGLLEDAYKLISTMPMKPNLAVLGALLSACGAQNKLDIAETITKVIESSCEYKGGAPVLLSNMYADENKWDEVSLIRKRAREDTRTPSGQSCIEVKGVVYRFTVEHKSHPEFIKMKDVLDTFGKVVHC
ncbi:hypothetical protein Taro_043398 [Colocasia esculenta]|uniref:Pentatricopeptide repeat-containing protein n=1 Tax=Colocasia esculenta TaxID=4460 RepID=A0A843WS04_COLES|nr:hypothetical protein [Colocasia esculenta]